MASSRARDSPFARVSSRRHTIEVSEAAGVRYLHFGTDWIQGAMRVARPFALELDYTREMMSPLLLRPDAGWPRHALLVGLGAGSMTKFLYRYRPECKLTVVEINPEVVAVARQSFRLPDEDERLTVHVADALEWVRESKKRFDLILIDGFDHNARAGALATEAFYRDCRARLTRQGVFAANLFGRSRAFRATVAALESVFDGRVLTFKSGDHGNVVALAAHGEPVSVDAAGLRAAADQLAHDTGLKLAPALARMQAASPSAAGGVVL